MTTFAQPPILVESRSCCRLPRHVPDAWRCSMETLAGDARAAVFPMPVGIRAAVAGGHGSRSAAPHDSRARRARQRSPVIIYRRERRPAGPRPCIFHIHGGGYVGGSAGSDGGLAVRLDGGRSGLRHRLGELPPCAGNALSGRGGRLLCGARLAVRKRRRTGRGHHAGGHQGRERRRRAGGGSGPVGARPGRIQAGVPEPDLSHARRPHRRPCRRPHPYTGEFVWTPENNALRLARPARRASPGSDGVSPYAGAPSRAGRDGLAGLPPTFIATGALDLFVEEDLEYARRLIRDGVPCELHVYPGGFHAFDIAPGRGGSPRLARRDTREALRRALLWPGLTYSDRFLANLSDRWDVHPTVP